MDTLSYHTIIEAPKEKIWNVLWSKETFSNWRKYFYEENYFFTDWKVGGKTYFLVSKGNGKSSSITHLNAPDEVTFNHLGYLREGIEDINSKAVKEWSGAPERFVLIPLDDGKIRLQIELKDFENKKEILDKTIPQGLQLIKQEAEK